MSQSTMKKKRILEWIRISSLMIISVVSCVILLLSLLMLTNTFGMLEIICIFFLITTFFGLYADLQLFTKSFIPEGFLQCEACGTIFEEQYAEQYFCKDLDMQFCRGCFDSFNRSKGE